MIAMAMSSVAQAEPGRVLFPPQENILQNAKLCVMANPRYVGYPISVYCSGQLALQVESFSSGYNNDKVSEESRAFSVVAGLMMDRGFKFLDQKINGADFITQTSVTFIKQN